MRALVALLFLSSLPVFAEELYKKPPKEILDVLNAPLTPMLSVSPARDWALLGQPQRYPSIAELAEPMLRLAGFRINPNTNGPHLGPGLIGLTLKKIADGSEIKLGLPPAAQLGAPEWSPDGKQFALTNTTKSAVELWVGDTTGKLRPLKVGRLAAAFGDPVR